MQTKNVNLPQSASLNEVGRDCFNGSSAEVCAVTEGREAVQNEPFNAPSVYLPLPHSTKHNQIPEVSNGCPSLPGPFGGNTNSPSKLSKPPIYQPPPLPPRGCIITGSPSKEWPQKELLCSSTANGTCGPYKPVPPPKPFAGNPILLSQQHHLQQQQEQLLQHQSQLAAGNDNSHSLLNGHASYPHILFTEQGQFVTHSLKFPIVDENEKLVQAFNEANSSLNQGIDNPALLSEPQPQSAGDQQGQHKESSPNHYAQMGPFDPSRHSQYLQNGHSQAFNRSSYLKSYQQPESVSSRPNHVQQNSVRFAAPLTNQSPSKPPHLNNNQGTRERNFYPLSQPQHAALMRGTVGGYEHSRETHYQDVNTGSFDPSLKFSPHCGRANGALPSSQTNGSIPHHEGGAYIHSSLNGGVSHVQRNGSMSGTNQIRANYVSTNVDSNAQSAQDIGSNAVANDDAENKKLGSFKKAGKKYSQFKHIFSNKFTKPEPKMKANEGSTLVLTQNKGTNSQGNSNELATNDSNDSLLKSERLLNAQTNEHFQRVITYSSLKSKLENPPQQQYDMSMLSSERQSGRTSQNPGVSFPLNSYGNRAVTANGTTIPKRAESCSHLGTQGQEQNPKSNPWGSYHRSDDNLTRVLASDQSYPVQSIAKDGGPREGRVSGGGSDSGRGTGAGSEFKRHDTSLESGSSNRVPPQHGHSSGNESEWIDIPEEEGVQSCFKKSSQNKVPYPEEAKTPPLPPLSPLGSPVRASRVPSNTKKSSNSFSSRGNKKPDIVETTEQNGLKQLSHLQNLQNANKSRPALNVQPAYRGKWNQAVLSKHNGGRETMLNAPEGRFHGPSVNEDNWHPLEKQFDDDELTSTDALDLNSVLDEATEATTDDENASVRDADSYLIRRQLEGLEGMYSEVLKVLGSRRNLRSEPRLSRRRTHGSVSSLPSSVVSSRAPRDRKGRVIDDRLRRTTKDGSKTTTHKRFQRIESHVVTLARSVAHLSSEMRTQHLMLQEIENLRNDVSALKLNVKSPTTGPSRGGAFRGSRFWGQVGAQGPSWSQPSRVKKLTQFFGDEPPLVRIFLRKLGYEKYAPIFEQEKIGMLELPYMTEERLEKIGIPLGPRLRIIEEAQGPITTDGNLSVYVV